MSILLKSSEDGFVPRLPRFNLAVAALGAMARTVRNRHAARRIADLPDYLLTDIGLKRDDVHDALAGDWREDPTFQLAARAAGPRRAG